MVLGFMLRHVIATLAMTLTGKTLLPVFSQAYFLSYLLRISAKVISHTGYLHCINK